MARYSMFFGRVAAVFALTAAASTAVAAPTAKLEAAGAEHDVAIYDVVTLRQDSGAMICPVGENVFGCDAAAGLGFAEAKAPRDDADVYADQIVIELTAPITIAYTHPQMMRLVSTASIPSRKVWEFGGLTAPHWDGAAIEPISTRDISTASVPTTPVRPAIEIEYWEFGGLLSPTP